MKIFSFDIFLSNFIIKKVENKKIFEIFSKISDYILIFLVLFFIFQSIRNVFFVLFVWLVTRIIQKYITKYRPFYYFNLSLNYNTPFNKSFPSLHTFLSTFILFKIFDSNILLSFFAIFIPILRIISLQHWVSDVIFTTILSFILYTIFSYLNFI